MPESVHWASGLSIKGKVKSSLKSINFYLVALIRMLIHIVLLFCHYFEISI